MSSTYTTVKGKQKYQLLTFCLSEITVNLSPLSKFKPDLSFFTNQSQVSLFSPLITTHAIGYILLSASLPTATRKSPFNSHFKKHPSRPITGLHQLFHVLRNSSKQMQKHSNICPPFTSTVQISVLIPGCVLRSSPSYCHNLPN